ncbi:hypothetical protein WMF18_16385 [Sorangium sp. So ce315]|uniref:hypothetical protein n=1 Tax=Sorangium sp. So ce315 TaxID=3133299 RepID=UPI003F5E3777
MEFLSRPLHARSRSAWRCRGSRASSRAGRARGSPAPPRRFILCTFPNGAPHHWWETAPAFGKTLKGADFKLPRVLEHFAPVKSKMLMISRLGNYTWSKEQSPYIEPSHSLYMSEMRTHDHDAYDLPIVLLGGDGVFLNDAHVAYDPVGGDRQLRDLWFTIMNQYHGLGVASFGDDRRGEPNALLEDILR